MGWLPVICGGVAAWLLHGQESSVWMWAAIVAAVASFWSYGVMHNYATNSAKRRAAYSGGFYDMTESDLDAVPTGWTFASMIASITCFGMLAYGAYVTWF